MQTEIEGTWEEIMAHAAELAGHRVRLTVLPGGAAHSGAAHPRPIEDIVADIMAGVPEEEWDRVPADLGENLDHYLYGAPIK